MELLFGLAVLPVIIIGIFIYQADKKEKEPISEIIKAFLFGFISIIMTLVISYILKINYIDVDTNNYFQVFLYSFCAISLIEELSKWICSYLFLRKNKNFNYLFDGIVYVTFVSLGFATIENILYTFTGGIATGIVRAITTVPAHAFFGIISGYHLALAKENNKNNEGKIHFIYSLLIPILLHGFYDFCLLTDSIIFYLIYLIFVVFLYIISMKSATKLQREDKSFISTRNKK